MKTKIFYLIVSVFLFSHLVGCGVVTKPGLIITDSKSNIHDVELKLSATADSVNNSLRELAEINRTIHPPAKIPSPLDPDTIGMGQLSTVDWNGPIGPLVKKIAESSGYKLNVLGTEPSIPVLISIMAKDTPLADILRDAEFQCGNKANIVVYPATKVIELRYAKSRQ